MTGAKEDSNGCGWGPGNHLWEEAPHSISYARIYICPHGGLTGFASPSTKAGEGWDTCQCGAGIVPGWSPASPV